MQLLLASISPRAQKAKSAAAEALTQEYITRAARMSPASTLVVDTECALLAAAERQSGRQSGSQASRAAAHLLCFDSRGDLLTSDEFARYLGRLRDEGAQRILLAIGPADGWSTAALQRAHRTLSLGRITLPHELARAVAAEQIYRALTILAGHPYHCGH